MEGTESKVKVGNLVLSYRSEAHDMPCTRVCLHLAVSQLESRDHYTRSKHLRRNKWRNPLCVFKIACLFFSFLATRKHFTAV